MALRLNAATRCAAVALLPLFWILGLPGSPAPGQVSRFLAPPGIATPVGTGETEAGVGRGATPVPGLPDALFEAGDPARGRDLTCADFASPAEAQRTLDADGDDPFGLDLDLDGIACETPQVSPGERDAARARQAERATPSRPTPAETPTPAAPVETQAPEVTPEDPVDLDCIDFTFQEDAQRVYDATPGDAYNLDPSGDGFACSSLPARGETVPGEEPGP